MMLSREHWNLNCKTFEKFFVDLELWNDVITWGGAFCARTDFRLSKLTKIPPSTQNFLSNEYFDLYLSIDTKNSHLYSILMQLQAAEWRRSKLKIFKPKKVKIENFELQKRYIHQKRAENIYNSVSAKKRKNFCKKKYFLKFFWFSQHARGPPCLLYTSPSPRD